ncbi:MAG: SDR family NAD(P)-dependent oxidoreductase [Beijerinckiaceae bacterium]
MPSILITGASSGIGAALAREIAAQGQSICILGRDAGRLADVAADAADRGAACTIARADVTDREELARVIAPYDAAHPVDILFINAGVFDGRKEGELVEDIETTLRVIETNLCGTINTLHAVLPGMRRRRRGHIVFVASLAGMTPLAGGLGYSASKSGIVAYALGLKQLLHGQGIKVTIVCPGFIDTPLADGYVGWQPFKISAEAAARKILRGMRSRRAIVAFPFALHLIARPSLLVPDFMRRFVGRLFSSYARPAAAPVNQPQAPGIAAE